MPEALCDGALTGSIASVVSSATLAGLSYRQTGHPLAAVNATSHWLWGRRSFRQNAPSVRFTLVGLVIHHAASMFWGVVAEHLFPSPGTRPRADALRNAAVISLAASVGDYLVVPRRLTPGVETRLSRGAVALFYVSFAAGLAAGMLWVRARRLTQLAESRRPQHDGRPSST